MPFGAYPQEKKTAENPVVQQAIVPEEKAESNPEPASEFEKILDKELEGGQKPEIKNDAPVNWFYQILKTIIGLGLIVGTIYLLRQYMVFKNKFTVTDSKIIKVLHEYPVASGKKLQIIEIGNKLLLLGISDAGIQLISEFKEKVSIDQIKLDMDTEGKTENQDYWVEISKIISDKIKNLFHKTPENKIFEEDDRNWQDMQSSHRRKLDQLKEKKKFFDKSDGAVENKHEL